MRKRGQKATEQNSWPQRRHVAQTRRKWTTPGSIDGLSEGLLRVGVDGEWRRLNAAYNTAGHLIASVAEMRFRHQSYFWTNAGELASSQRAG